MVSVEVSFGTIRSANFEFAPNSDLRFTLATLRQPTFVIDYPSFPDPFGANICPM
jgi:hypothetical protein